VGAGTGLPWGPVSPPGPQSCTTAATPIVSEGLANREEVNAATDSLAADGPVVPGQRGERGMPMPTMAMMSRWISLVPPPKVKMV